MLCALTIFFSAMMTTFVCKKNDIKSNSLFPKIIISQ